MTRDELRQLLRDYLEVPDEPSFESNIDRFIRQSEERIYYLVQLPFFRRNVEGTTNANNRYLLMPEGFKFAYSLCVGSGADKRFLINKDVNFMREAFPDPTSLGFPRYYAIFDETSFILGPTPDQSYPSELHYNYEPQSLVDDPDGVTWLSDNAEDALLYGALVEAYTFLKGEAELMANYNERFGVAIRRLKNLGEAHDRRDAYRSGEIRREVQ